MTGRRLPDRERLGAAAILLAVWTMLWGDLRPAALLGGAVVAVAVLVAYPTQPLEPLGLRVRPLRMLHVVAHFAVDLVVSTLSVGRAVVVGPRRVATGIVACPLRVDVDGIVTFLANTVALSPGTLPVHITKDPLVMYVHVLRLVDPEQVRRQVSRLEELAVAAVGTPAMIEACRQPPPRPPHHDEPAT